MENKIQELQKKVDYMCIKFDEVMRFGEPNRQIQEWAYKFDELSAKFQNLNRQFTAIMEEKLIEIVSDSEIKKLWVESGVPLKQIEAEFNITSSSAHALVNGNTKNVHDRNKIKQYLLRKIRENQKGA